MATQDVIILGGGISGLALAYRAAKAGKKVLVLEASGRIGGCIHSVRREDGFWFELGAHTAYNSYGGFLEIAEASGVSQKIVERGLARKCFGLLRNGSFKWLSPIKVLFELSWVEAAIHFPRGIFSKKSGRTIRSFYSQLIGPRNYDRVLSPFLAAVPSQSADDFPVEGPGSLFKTRPRRSDFPRSYGFEGGLQSVCDGAARLERVTVRTGLSATRVLKTEHGVRVQTSGGESFEAGIVAVAVAPDRARDLLADSFPGIADTIGQIKMVELESSGFILPRDCVQIPPSAFLVPVNDMFFSTVTRDPFPDARYRAFAFHFRAGLPSVQRMRRMSEVLSVGPEKFGEVFEKKVRLPAPRIGHAAIIGNLDRQLATEPRLAITGNYFAGLAIEDCVQRSFAEWDRVSRQ